MLTTGLTFRALITRVAEDNGVADMTSGAAGPPTSAQELDRIKRAINDGREMMRRDYPRFFQLQPEVTVAFSDTAGAHCLGSDASTFVLPPSIAMPARDLWTWTRTDGSITNAGKLAWRSMTDIDELHARNPELSGPPRAIGLAPTPMDLRRPGQPHGTYLRIWPKPDGEYECKGRARVRFLPLADDAEFDELGADHDQTLRAAANFIYNMRNPNQALVQRFEKQYQDALLASINIDQEYWRGDAVLDEPSTTVGQGGYDPAVEQRRVTHYNDIAL